MDTQKLTHQSESEGGGSTGLDLSCEQLAGCSVEIVWRGDRVREGRGMSLHLKVHSLQLQSHSTTLVVAEKWAAFSTCIIATANDRP